MLIRQDHFSDQTFALLVGIGSYRDKGLTDLPACPLAAEKLAKVLADPDGCAVPSQNIVLIPDDQATDQGIRDALSDLVARCGPESTLVIYLAGHGDLIEQEFCFLTGNADQAVGLRASSLDEILAPLRLRGTLLLTDCCGGAELSSHAPSFFRMSDNEAFRIFISAARRAQSSFELVDTRQSLFSARLIRALRPNSEAASDGAIYYQELYRYLHSSVQEDVESNLGDRREQEPVAIGIHAGNPLLFLQRDLSVSRARLKQVHITREHLRKRVIASVGVLTTLVAIVLAGYWAYLDGHQYWHAPTQLTLTHGVPDHSGFGLPKDDWQLALNASSIEPGHSLADGPLTLPRGEDAFAALGEALRPGARALLFTWQGQHQVAQETLLSTPRGTSFGSDGRLALRDLTLQGKEAQFIELLPTYEADDAVAVIEALRKTQPEQAIAAFRQSPLAKGGYELNLLASWESACGPHTQAWLDSFYERGGWLPIPTIATMTVVTGCKFPELLLYKDPTTVRDGIYALRLTDPARAEQLNHELLEVVDAYNRDRESFAYTPTYKQGQVMFAAIAGPYLATTPCVEPRLGEQALVYEGQALEAVLTGLVMIARGCKGYSIDVTVHPTMFEISLVHSGLRTRMITMALANGVGPDVLRLIDALLPLEAVDVRPLTVHALQATRDGLLREALIQRLTYLRVPEVDVMALRLAGQPRLDRAIVDYLAQQNAGSAADYLRTSLRVPASDLITTFSWLRLDSEQTRFWLGQARSWPMLERTLTRALLASGDEVADLLTDPNAGVRQVAADYAPLRDDWDKIEQLTIERKRYPDVALLYAQATRRKIVATRELIARTPGYAQAWLVKKLEHHRAQSHAEQLALERIRREMHLPP